MLIFIAGKRRDDDDDDDYETSGKIQKARARVTEIYNLKNPLRKRARNDHTRRDDALTFVTQGF